MTVNLLFAPDVLLPLLWQGGSMLAYVALGLLFYGWLADRALFEGGARVAVQQFGRVDVAIAGFLTAVFVLLITSHQDTDTVPSATDMVVGVILSTTVFVIIVAGIVAALLARHISCRETFGFGRTGFGTTAGSAVLLLCMAYPLIYGALTLTRLVLAASGQTDEDPQEIVRFLGTPGHGAVRIVVAVSAVVFAPFLEEFIFRGYLYGVIKRYAGIGPGLLLNAALFAGIHVNAPSFGGLFVLAVCLTLAYEWTGSIFVPMTIHALFNALSVVSLLSGGNG